jgi:hypothetical protein
VRVLPVSGDAVIVGPTDGPCVEVDTTGPGSFTLDLTVCNENGPEGDCCDECDKIVDVVPEPECLIDDGPDEVCEGDTGIEYCAVNPADTYEWSISGDGVIVGPTDGPCVLVDAGSAGSFTLELTVCNEDGPDGDCCDTCTKTVDVVPCGGEGCTPGFWKNNADKHEASAWPKPPFPGEYFDSVFNVDVELRTKSGDPDNPTLLEALGAKGGGINALARHATAALLNITSDCVNYGIGSWSDLRQMVQDAIDGVGDYTVNELAEHLDELNNAEEGCPLNQQGECEDD